MLNVFTHECQAERVGRVADAFSRNVVVPKIRIGSAVPDDFVSIDSIRQIAKPQFGCSPCYTGACAARDVTPAGHGKNVFEVVLDALSFEVIPSIHCDIDGRFHNK